MSCDQEPKVCQNVEALIEAATKVKTAKDWEKIDQELLPHLKELDQNSTARALLSHARDKKSDVRDVVASGLGILQIEDKDVLQAVFEQMLSNMIIDLYKPKGEFAAGRAAMVVWKNKENPEFEDRANEALDHFKRIVKSRYNKNLEEKLVKNIPGMENIFRQEDKI